MLPKKYYKKILKELTYSKPRLALLIFLIAVFTGGLILVGITGWDKIRERISKDKQFDPTKPTTISYQGETIYVPPNVLEITPEELYRQIQRKEKVIIIQIITNMDEWYKGHISGSTFVFKNDFSSAPPGTLTNEQYIVLVSQDGKDSALAADTLVSRFGFNRNKTLSLKGGLAAWRQSGYKLEK